MDEMFALSRDARNRLVLSRAGQGDAVDVRVRRAFPWSSPTRHVSIRGSDGKELVLIDDLEKLEREERALIEEALEQGSFIPKITRIDRVDIRWGYQQWKVRTDRGPADFRVQEREDIRFLHDGRFAIKDAEGNVYELASLATLDEHSRRAIQALL